MAPTRYSLHYEDYSEHMMSRFGKLLQMQSLVDMTLMCNSHTLRVHKAVLAASSAYFQEVLQKQIGEPLIILKMRFSVLKSLVEFMYCGKTQCAEDNLDELVAAAQFLKIKGLAKVTREGLGIPNPGELPVFAPPVVINRPPQSIIDLHTQQQDTADPKAPALPQLPLAPAPSSGAPADPLGRPSKPQDQVVRIPFDIESGGGASTVVKPRRGRPTARVGSRVAGAWESGSVLSRAAGRALLRREQDSRKAIHQLKHLQSRHMQDYMSMERVSLSHAVNSICGPDPPPSYLNMDPELMYMNQAVPPNVLDPSLPAYAKEAMPNETITSRYAGGPDPGDSGISTAMSQYVNALKNAGLPTDLPILFESGDGSYINVNEQVLLDMVQSSEIQYEVIEQPNIIERVADPSEIKSIDDLSKSIERGEMMVGGKGYSAGDYDKGGDQYSRHDDSLNSILPDNLESFGEQQNFVVLDPPLQGTNNMDAVNANDFSCIDGDMQFFTKSMSDDVKKYYEEPHLNDPRVMEQLCPTSTSLDTNFNMSLLDAKSSLAGPINQPYNPLQEDMRRNVDCYDFGLPLPQTNVFKEDALACLMAATPKRTDDDERAQERDEIIKDLMNIEQTMTQNNNEVAKTDFATNVQDYAGFEEPTLQEIHTKDKNDISSHELSEWQSMDMTSDKVDETAAAGMSINQGASVFHNIHDDSVIDLTDSTKNIQLHTMTDNCDKENVCPDDDRMGDSIDNDIPFAVGLLPLKQVQPTEDNVLVKRKHAFDNILNSVDAQCLKRKVKYKKL